MNLPTPQEQFASKQRLDAQFRPYKLVKRAPIRRAPKPASVTAEHCPWPCFAGDFAGIELPSGEYVSRQTVRNIVITVARRYHMEEADIYSSRKTDNIVLPRHIAMYLAKVMTQQSLPEIGKRFGGKDHTTVLHACRRIERMMAESPAFAGEVNAIRARLEGGK
jgi:hypothetical protein